MTFHYPWFALSVLFHIMTTTSSSSFVSNNAALIAIQEQRPENEPRSAQASCQLGVLQSRNQGEKHGLRGILQEVAVGTLRTVELLRFGRFES